MIMDPAQRDELMARFIELRSEGHTLRECSTLLEKPLGTLSHWNHNCKDIISARRAEWLARTYGVTKDEQVKVYRDLTRKVFETISKADFSTLSAGELIQVLFKTLDNQARQLNDLHY